MGGQQLGGQLDPAPRARPTIRRGLGALTAAQQAQLVNDVNEFNALTNSNFDPSTVATAVNLISTDGPLVVKAIGALQQGNQAGTYAAATAIIAGAVAVANPVAGAVVGGILAAAGSIAQSIGLFGGSTKSLTCSWKFPPTPADQRGVCFGPNMVASYVQPDAPIHPDGTSNPLWLPLATFASAELLSPSAQAQLRNGVPCADVSGVKIGTCATSVNASGVTTVTGPGGASWSWTDPNFNIGSGQGYDKFTWLDDLNTGSAQPFGDQGHGGYRVLECAAAELSELGDTGPLAAWWQVVAGISNHGTGAPPNWPIHTPGMRAFALAYARAFQTALEYPLNGYKFFGGQQLLTFLQQAWNKKYSAYASNVQTFDGTGSSLIDMTVRGYTDAWATQGNPSQISGGHISIYDPPANALATGLSQAAMSAEGAAADAAAARASVAAGPWQTQVQKPGVHPAAVAGVATGGALVGAAVVGVVTQQSISAVFGSALDGVRKAVGIRLPWER